MTTKFRLAQLFLLVTLLMSPIMATPVVAGEAALITGPVSLGDCGGGGGTCG